MLTLKTQRTASKCLSKIVIELDGEKLVFNGKQTVKLEKKITNIAEETNLYECFNQFIESTFDEHKQRHLFGLYKSAHDIVESGRPLDYEQDITLLVPIVNQIIDLVNFHKFSYFINSSGNVIVPKDLMSATNKGDYPAETTIFDTDYAEIVYLSLMVRTVYPIVYTQLTRYAGNIDKRKIEQVFGDLIKGNRELNNCLGWRKIRQYIEFTLTKRGVVPQLEEISSQENFADRMLFKIIYSRLCVAVIPETEPNKNIAKTINSEIKNTENSSKIFNNKDGGFDEDEDNRSVYERYNITEQVNSTQEEKQAEYFTFGLYDERDNERHKDRFKYQCMGLKIKQPELVELVYDNFPDSWEFDLHPHIVTILQLVYFCEVSPMVYHKCNMNQLKAAIALAQVRLSEQGYEYLPMVLCAIHDPEGSRTISEVFKLNEEDRDYLVSICDIYVRNKIEERSMNEAIIAATMFLDKFSNGIWQSNLEPGCLENIDIYRRYQKGSLFPMEMVQEIKTEFMRLVKQANS